MLATAVNKVIPSPAPVALSTQAGVNAVYAGLGALLAASTNQTRSGTYQLATVYCQPRSHKGGEIDQNAPLQILLHGSTYTKEYWDRGSWGYGSYSLELIFLILDSLDMSREYCSSCIPERSLAMQSGC